MEKTMEEQVKEERREYFKKWRLENKDRVKKHNASYWKNRTQKKIDAENQVAKECKTVIVENFEEKKA